jgi:hypothetical protein
VETETVGQELSRLWSGAMIFAPHLAGCSCAGGFHVPLDPGAIEQDLLEFLRHRYRQDGREKLAAFVQDRLEANEASRSRPDFANWLGGLDAAALPQADLDRLAGDIRMTLESMNGATRAAGNGFVCY